MKKFLNLTARNIKLYFTDKGMFITSLITPLILLVLFATFLGNVYKSSFTDMIPEGIEVSKNLINGLVSGQLISSLLAVSSVTVAFCSNLLMVQDKVTGAYKDMMITPISKKTLSLSYFFASFISTLIVNLFAFAICLIYIAINYWYLSVSSVFIILSNIVLLTLFGCALSSIINFFLNTQGQISAVGTIVSSGYGFICGAYMPISSFGKGLQNVLSFLPGTYGTSLLKNNAMHDIFVKLESVLPSDALDVIKQSIDCKVSFFNHTVSIPAMYVIMIISIVVLISVYIMQNMLRKN